MENKPSNAQDNGTEVDELLAHVCPTPWADNGLDDCSKISLISFHFTEIMKILGLDLNDDSLKKTPERLAKMYVLELFSGLKSSNFPKITSIENKMNFNEMITVGQIRINSTCEHHFVTIDGEAKVSYIPRHKIIGLSKINRIVRYFSRRPTVQERLTKQIADCLEIVLETKDVAVMIKAKHFCVVSRGVEDIGSVTTTTDLRGEFVKAEVRAEFLKS